MLITTSRFFKSLGVLAVVSLCASSPVSAISISLLDITGTGARNFSDPTIWNSSTVPGPSDFPTMDSGDGINDYVYIDAATDVQRINVGHVSSGGLEIRSGATLTTSATGGSQSNIGPSGTGHLRILSGATLNQGGLLYLGLNSTGVGMVTLDNGTHTLGGALSVARGAGTGIYNMLGGTLTVGDFFQVANTGNGTFTQSGGILEANRNAAAQGMFLAGAPGSVGTYEISGGSLTVANTNTGVINGTTDPAGGAFGTFRIVGSAPTVTIRSSYDQRQDSSLEMVIEASGVSPMNVGGDAILDGLLGVSFTTTPSFGQQFTIMNYGGNLSGNFSAFDSLVDGPSGTDSILLGIDYGTGANSSIFVTVLEQLGDFNMMDGVNESDFFILSDNLGAHLDQVIAYSDGDINNDGKIDLVDFDVFKNLYPVVVESALAQMAVPEPSTWALATLAGIAGSFAARRRRSRR